MNNVKIRSPKYHEKSKHSVSNFGGSSNARPLFKDTLDIAIGAEKSKEPSGLFILKCSEVPDSIASGAAEAAEESEFCLFGFCTDDSVLLKLTTLEEKRRSNSVLTTGFNDSDSSAPHSPIRVTKSNGHSPSSSPIKSPRNPTLLGRGGQAKVYTDLKGNYAYKNVNGDYSELDIRNGIKNPKHIVPMYPTVNGNFLVMPKAIGDFSRFIEEIHNFLLSGEREEIKSLFIADIVFQIITGLNSLHKSGYVYCDLKPQNILVYPKNRLYLTDLGSCIKSGANLTESAAITEHYSAPELMSFGRSSFREELDIHHVPFSEKIDSWSLGIILYQLVMGEEYVKNEISSDSDFVSDLEILKFLSVNGEKNSMPKFKQLARQLKLEVVLGKSLFNILEDVIRNCLNVNPEERYSLESVFQIFYNLRNNTLKYDKDKLKEDSKEIWNNIIERSIK
jgi:hypothetical protein